MPEFVKNVDGKTPRNKGWVRKDVTNKGLGYFGSIKRPDGSISTELSMGVDFGKGEMQIPTLVPGLTNSEIDHLISGRYNPSDRQGLSEIISQKAIQFARQRMAQGLPVFARKEEEGRFTPAPIPISPLATKLTQLQTAPNPVLPAPVQVPVAPPQKMPLPDSRAAILLRRMINAYKR